jgi:hypothetical protein
MNRSVLLVLVDKELPSLKPKIREDLLTMVLDAIKNPECFLRKCKELDKSKKDENLCLVNQARDVIRKYGLIKYDPTENIKVYNKLCDIPEHILIYYRTQAFYPIKDLDIKISLQTIHYVLSHFLLQLYHVEGLENELIFYIANHGWLTPKKPITSLSSTNSKAIKYTLKGKVPHPIQDRSYVEQIHHIYFTRSSQPKFWSKIPIRLGGDFV